MSVDFGSIFSAVDLETATRKERFGEFELFVEDELSQSQAHVIALALLNIGSSLPGRDSFEVTISVDGEAASASDNEQSSRDRIGGLFELGSDSQAQVSFRVTIRKSVRDNTVSVYDMEAFGSYLVNEPLRQVLEEIASRLNGYLRLECSGLLRIGGNCVLQFVPEGYANPVMLSISSIERDRTITLFKETSFSASIPGSLVPQDFCLEVPLGHQAIDSFFVRASAVLSAIYLCNNAELESDNTLSYRLAGYKVLEERSVPLAALAEANDVLSKIAGWAYDAGGSTDKVGLARNVLSLHVASLCDLAEQPQVLSAILSNYQIYLKDNVSAYLDVRNRMAELLLESTAKTHALVESLLDSVRNGMLVVFTFVLTVVVVNGLKDTNVRLIFSGEYFWIVVIISVLCSVWIHHACKDVLERFDSAIRATKQLLRDSYRNVLVEDEVDQHTASTFSSNRKHLVAQVHKYRLLWYQVCVILVATFAIGYLVSSQSEKLSAAKEYVRSFLSASPSGQPVQSKTMSGESKNRTATPYVSRVALPASSKTPEADRKVSAGAVSDGGQPVDASRRH